MNARPVGTLALDLLTECRTFAYDEMDGARWLRADADLRALLAERDALKAALEASRADAARLAEAGEALTARGCSSDAWDLWADAMDAHRALNGGAL